jgi:hypothetical protein
MDLFRQWRDNRARHVASWYEAMMIAWIAMFLGAARVAAAERKQVLREA